MNCEQNRKTLWLPLAEKDAEELCLGQAILLNGPLFTARDAAHRRLLSLLDRGEPLPITLEGTVLYYCGPCPPPPGRPVGAAGPTTSARMDPYLEPLLALGLRGTIGKGPRSPEAMAALARYRAVYLQATGGAGAMLATRIISAEVAAFADLGPEAVYKMEVQDFPVVVAGDVQGGDLFARAHPS